MQKCTWFAICFFFLNSHFYQACNTNQQPLLVITIMVKNEAQVMEATLKPFLEAGLQHYLILDTGSTDNTVQVVRDLFEKYNVSHGYIVEQPFVNFSVSRNYALKCAEDFFPRAIFFLMIDAEWYMHNVQGLLKFCEKHQNSKSLVFLIKRYIASTGIAEYACYLFKAHKGIQFCGAVHEFINKATNIKAPDNIFITYNPSRCGHEKSCKRWRRDLDILLKEHENNPNNLRTIFYLGQTYNCLKNYEQALFWYGKRCKNKDTSEENYLTHYRMGLIYENLGNWPQALFFYFKAHQIRPNRIEALIHIAQYYLSIHDYYAAFLLANYITTISVSDQEQLYVAPKMFDFARYDILATAAWYVGEYEIARKATLQALQHDPSDVGLRKNLLMYEQVLNHRDCNLLSRYSWCQWCNGNFWLNRPAWFNFCCLAHGCYQTNRCNFSQGVTWRYWVGPFSINFFI